MRSSLAPHLPYTPTVLRVECLAPVGFIKNSTCSCIYHWSLFLRSKLSHYKCSCAKMTCDVASRSSAANDDVAPTNGSENGKYRIDSTTAATIVLLCKRYYDVAIVCVVILVVWALFALPTIFYNWPMKVTVCV